MLALVSPAADGMAMMTSAGRRSAMMLRQLGGRPDDLDPVEPQPPLARVVVDDADRRVAERWAAQHLADDQLACVPGPDDERLFPACDERSGPGALEDGARQQADPGDEAEQQEQVEREHAARHPESGNGIDEIDRKRGDQARDDDAPEHRPHVADRHVAPPVAVEPEEDEDRQLEGNDDVDRLLEQPAVGRRDPVVEAQPVGQVPGAGDQARVHRHLPQLAAGAEPHAALSRTARSTHSATVFCTSAPIPAQSGKARFSRAAFSVSGSEPGA